MAASPPVRIAIAVPAAGALCRHEDMADALAALEGVEVGLVAASEPHAGEHADLLVDLGGGGAAAHCAKRRWRLLDGDGRDLSGPFPALAATAAAIPIATVVLAEQGGSRGMVELGRAVLAAPDRACHPLIDRLWAAARHLVVRAVAERVAPPAGGTFAAEAPVSAVQAGALHLAGCLRRTARRLHRIVVEESWMVGVVDRPIADLLTVPELPPVRWLAARDPARYYADPFGLPDGRILCEELRHEDGIGRIIELSPDGVRPCPVPAAGHLSYPALFEDGGALYCVPEAAASRRCVIYRLDGGNWLPMAAPLEDCGAADPTLFRWGGLYWLAYSDADLGAHDTLCLAWAERLEGPWTRHPGNPVKWDAGSSRPGGTPFVHLGRLYRPAQDCRRTYGGAVAFNCVARLDPYCFAEEVVRVLAPPPGPYPHGLHTVSAWGGRTLVDAKRHGLNAVALRRKLARRLARHGGAALSSASRQGPPT